MYQKLLGKPPKNRAKKRTFLVNFRVKINGFNKNKTFDQILGQGP